MLESSAIRTVVVFQEHGDSVRKRVDIVQGWFADYRYTAQNQGKFEFTTQITNFVVWLAGLLHVEELCAAEIVFSSSHVVLNKTIIVE